MMKRFLLALLALGLVAVSFFQFRLSEAQDDDGTSAGDLRVVSLDVETRLRTLGDRLDTDDASTARFAALMESNEGEIAISGLLNHLSEQSREAARAEAIERFVDAHFDKDSGGKFVIRAEPRRRCCVGARDRAGWRMTSVSWRRTTADLSDRIDVSTEAGGLFRRLLNDEQAPVAILLFEMEGGGDVVARFLAEAMETHHGGTG